MYRQLHCVLPWKALCMDERDGEIFGVPCCLGWIQYGHEYGKVGSVGPTELWNSEKAQRMRRLILDGQQDQVCSQQCPYRISGELSELRIPILDGPPTFMENQALNNEEIRRRRTVLHSRPMLLKVMPTLRCNLRCSMCYQGSYHQPDFGVNFWEEIENALPFACKVTFLGGEVTLMPEFRDFIHSQAHHFSHTEMSLITNGTALDKDLLGLFGKIAMSDVTVSINAATSETYNRITKSDLFDRVVDSVRELQQVSRSHPVHAFHVFLSFVVMRSNFRELPQFLCFAKELGTQVRLLPVSGNRGNESILACPEIYEEYRTILQAATAAADGPFAGELRNLTSHFDRNRPGGDVAGCMRDESGNPVR